MFKSKALWYAFLLVWIAGSAYWHVCKIKALCDADLITPTLTVQEIKPFIISDNSSFRVESKGNFAFAVNGIVANRTQVQPQLDSLASYLASNPDKLLIITGYYSPQEINTTTFPDLGRARADGIKRWFRKKGIADSLITLKSQVSSNLAILNDSIQGGIQFGFKNYILPSPKITLTENELAGQQKYQNIFKPLDLYFPTASISYIKTDQNQLFISEAKEYLAKNKDKNLILTGHTDDEDSAEWNLVLSKRRANVIKKQFIAIGIPSERILTIGKGESEPKAANNTPEGKRANRRVTIVVR